MFIWYYKHNCTGCIHFTTTTKVQYLCDFQNGVKAMSEFQNTGELLIILRGFCANVVAVENVFWVCACRLSYPACNAHAPCCCLWSARLCTVYSQYLKNGRIFEKRNCWICNIFLFSLQILSDIFLTVGTVQPAVTTTVYRSVCTVPVLLAGFGGTLIV